MSLSGPRKFDDPRNKLYLSYIRLVREIQPTAFVIENVIGIVSLFKGQIKDTIIEEFSKMGYKVQFKVLLASDYGVPQNRNVLFLWGRGMMDLNILKHWEQSLQQRWQFLIYQH